MEPRSRTGAGKWLLVPVILAGAGLWLTLDRVEPAGWDALGSPGDGALARGPRRERAPDAARRERRPGDRTVAASEDPLEHGAAALDEVKRPVAQGRVVSETGEPAAGALVILRGEDGGWTGQGTADTEGRYELPLPIQGSVCAVALSAQHGVGSTAWTAVVPDQDSTLHDLVCRPHGAVEGRVTLPTGEPVVGAQVFAVLATGDDPVESLQDLERMFDPAEFEHSDYVHGASSQAGTTAADGEFRLAGLVPGEYLVGVWAGSRGDAITVRTLTGSPVDLVLEAYTLRVRVRDGEGAPITRAEVLLECESGHFWSELCSASGDIQMFVEPGPWDLRVEVEGAAPVESSLVVRHDVYAYEAAAEVLRDS